MTQSNIGILQSYFDEVINQNNITALPRYFSEQFVGHDSPYVGMGVMLDDHSDEKVTIRRVFPGSPAEGKLMVGDEILRVVDGEHTWSSHEELRQPMWGQGVPGSTVTVWVQRDKTEQEIIIERGLVKGADVTYQQLEPAIREDLSVWRELKVTAENLMESGDRVAYQAKFQGFNSRYKRSAVWTEFGFVRFKDGKIIERWISDEGLTLYKQLGFTILGPEIVKA